MEELTKLTVDTLLDRTAQRTPTPGGGSVTGVAGALACSLARMVAAYSVRKDTDATVRLRIEETAAQLHRADELLRALITQDATAYAGMTETAKRVREDPSDPAVRTAHNEAVLAGVAVPMEMAAIASNALAAMDEFKTVASRYLLSDLAIAAVLAEATARSSWYTVGINAPELTDVQERMKVLSDVDDILEHCARCRESIETYVRGRLEAAASDGR